MVAPELDHPDAARSAEELTALVGHGLLDYASGIGAHCRDVRLLTVGGEQVDAQEPVALPAQAAMAAMHRSIGSEHTDQQFRHLDLPSWELDPRTAEAAAAVALSDLGEAALRAGRSGPVLYRRTLSTPRRHPPWRPETVCSTTSSSPAEAAASQRSSPATSRRGGRGASCC
ncbi:hypothetical protein [Mycolicibacterium insubricum]|uniref:hypothetical protein n=1 Tax=Mycolicibacterium insubricum TaxID=444597 RepID=UPI0021F31DBC|nr:hypothetical protein [Mycolicibacterium insubricum]MCV7082968.1 hypothetical protein [Mycolicibacterium insubricum]